MKSQFTVNPWHGISAGDDVPNKVTVFVEIVPADRMKFELDKPSGFLKIDRPQKFANGMPAPYGFIPQTYCDDKVKNLAVENGSTDVTEGDHDPLDILVLTSHSLITGNFICQAIPIGGFKMIDGGEADDKIIAVLEGDQLFGDMKNISDLPDAEIKRLKHYFLTYKNLPTEPAKVRIDSTYDADHAKKVIIASIEDYKTNFGE